MKEEGAAHLPRPDATNAVPDTATLVEVNRLWTVVRALTNTVHDVNNALQVISGSVELLDDHDFDPVIRRRLEAIRAEAAKAAVAVNRLLTYARAQPLPVRAVSLDGLVRSVVEMRLASTGRRRIVMSIDRASDTSCLALVDEN